MDTPSFDHVAIRVNDREAMASELLRRFDWRILEQTDRFTLLGAHPDFGKLTLLDAEPGDPPRATRIVSIVLVEDPGSGTPPPQVLQDGLVFTFVNGTESLDGSEQPPRHAIVGVTLRATDPPLVAAHLHAQLDMRIGALGPEMAVVDVGQDAGAGRIILMRERWDRALPSMLDHVGIRVADADRWRSHAQDEEVEVVRWVEAEHSRAVFVAGPDELLLEFVELTSPIGVA